MPCTGTLKDKKRKCAHVCVCVCDWGVWPGAREEDGVCVCMH